MSYALNEALRNENDALRRERKKCTCLNKRIIKGLDNVNSNDNDNECISSLVTEKKCKLTKSWEEIHNDEEETIILKSELEQSEIDELKRENQNLKRELKRRQDDFDKELHDKQQFESEMNDKITESYLKVKKLKDEIEFLSKERRKEKEQFLETKGDLDTKVNEINTISIQLKEEKSKHQSVKGDVDVLVGKLNESKSELETVREELDKKCAGMKELTDEINANVEKWQKIVFDAENKLIKVREEKEEAGKELEIKYAEVKKLQHRIEEAKVEKETMRIKLEWKDKEIKELKEIKVEDERKFQERIEVERKLQEQIEEVKIEEENVRIELKIKDMKIKELKEKMNEEEQKWVKKLSKTENELSLCKEEKEQLQKKIQVLEGKLKIYETPIPVHLSIARGVGEYNEAAHILLEKIKDNLIKHKIDLLTHEISERSPDEKEAPMVVFCLNSSRLGTDVDATYNKQVITKSVRSALVIFNHRPKHNTKVTPSESLLGNPTKEKNLIDMVTDCVYWSADGFHDCDLNEEAVKNISLYIRKKMVK